jgi:hypothetical protein
LVEILVKMGVARKECGCVGVGRKMLERCGVESLGVVSGEEFGLPGEGRFWSSWGGESKN